MVRLPSQTTVSWLLLLFSASVQTGCLLDWSGQLPDAASVVRPDLDAGVDQASDQLISTDLSPGIFPGTWMMVPAGRFVMGSPSSELCRDSITETQRLVSFTNGFEISTTEVTQRQYEWMMNDNPSEFSEQGSGQTCGPDCPVEKVSWNDAARYCNALSKLGGLTPCYDCEGQDCGHPAYPEQKIYGCPGYRLPTGAEWEYAYRAGVAAALFDGRNVDSCETLPRGSELGWYKANALMPQPVGLKPPNSWGLYDMAGNVAEWCHDYWLVGDPWVVWDREQKQPGQPHPLSGHGKPRTEKLPQNLRSLPMAINPVNEISQAVMKVLRGGSFHEKAQELRAASSRPILPRMFSNDSGFRCIRTLPPTEWVFSRLIVPTQEGEFAMVFDDSGEKKNAVATMIYQLSFFLNLSLGTQLDFDNMLAKAEVLAAMRLYGGGFTSAALLQLMQVVDLDQNRADNFSGQETFGFINNPDINGLLRGTLENGEILAGPDPLRMWSFYWPDRQIDLKNGRVEAQIVEDNMTGAIGGVLSEAEARVSIYTLAMELIEDLLDGAPSEDRQLILTLFDTPPYDEKISIEEVEKNDLVNALLVPDVDLNGDGVNDSFSLAIGFEAVRCTIRP